MLDSERKFRRVTLLLPKSQSLVSERTGSRNQVFLLQKRGSFYSGQESKEGYYLSTVSDIIKFKSLYAKMLHQEAGKEI